ncbi:hypothetical protein RC856_003818 [Vibrio fluvialis]|nr:hypothetical protein [Vibrio fluvialis]ELE2167097.1 hypothetical protein [Vibrio fluvialis]
MQEEKLNTEVVELATKELRALLSKYTNLSEFEKMLTVKNLGSELENQIAIRMQSAALYSVLVKLR